MSTPVLSKIDKFNTHQVQSAVFHQLLNQLEISEKLSFWIQAGLGNLFSRIECPNNKCEVFYDELNVNPLLHVVKIRSERGLNKLLKMDLAKEIKSSNFSTASKRRSAKKNVAATRTVALLLSQGDLLAQRLYDLSNFEKQASSVSQAINDSYGIDIVAAHKNIVRSKPSKKEESAILKFSLNRQTIEKIQYSVDENYRAKDYLFALEGLNDQAEIFFAEGRTH